MVSTLVCRTCLYVGETMFSFKTLDKVKLVLEMFIPEIKNCLEKTSLICEQCYYFLKNVEKFKSKCLETQQKLYSMNTDSIRKERECVIKNSNIDCNKRKVFPVKSLPTVKHKRVKHMSSIQEIAKSTISTEFGTKTMHVDHLKCLPSTNVQLEDEDFNEEDDDTKSLLEEEDSGSEDKLTEKDCTNDSSPIEIIEVTSDEDDINPNEHNGKVEFRMRKSLNKPKSKDLVVEKANPDIVRVKIETDENPGFFNKKCTNGFYKCKLCIKRYKTSKGLYNHTKASHREEVKFHHCQYCSFFTLWKSALTRHSTVYHENVILHSICPHCKFETRSQDQLNRHILENHVYETYTNCTLCRARFTHKTAFMEHIKNEHINVGLPNTMKCSHFCSECSVLFLSLMDYRIHLAESHNTGVVLCDKCDTICSNKEEFYEHKKKVHDMKIQPLV